ncbi:hypothetical protein GIB67_033503 [Kingdonia uniflora]|uniref:Subtilisin-like protease fibronectin type-III domain-containing protein n=1 Tax=Kingdonia uniflora TaxID=39325 RepID=A0A7J7L6B8_9MAGN|nr:hypothetical protein GIB67_033503 [Kingdonia uniflora]
MMTTTNHLDNTNNPILNVEFSRPTTGLDMGAGQIDPNRALNPGLIYDAGIKDYDNFICSLNFKMLQLLTIVTSSSYNCLNSSSHLNYPTFIASFSETSPTTQEFKKIMTNVGDSSFNYSVELIQPSGAIVNVSPNKLVFQKKIESLSFIVNIMDTLERNNISSSGAHFWIDTNGKHTLRSPIVVMDPPSDNTKIVYVSFICQINSVI